MGNKLGDLKEAVTLLRDAEKALRPEVSGKQQWFCSQCFGFRDGLEFFWHEKNCVWNNIRLFLGMLTTSEQE